MLRLIQQILQAHLKTKRKKKIQQQTHTNHHDGSSIKANDEDGRDGIPYSSPESTLELVPCQSYVLCLVDGINTNPSIL